MNRTIKRYLNVAPVEALLIVVLLAALAVICWADWHAAGMAAGALGMALVPRRAEDSSVPTDNPGVELQPDAPAEAFTGHNLAEEANPCEAIERGEAVPVIPEIQAELERMAAAATRRCRFCGDEMPADAPDRAVGHVDCGGDECGYVDRVGLVLDEAPRTGNASAKEFTAGSPAGEAPRRCKVCGAVEGDGRQGCLETEPPQHRWGPPEVHVDPTLEKQIDAIEQEPASTPETIRALARRSAATRQWADEASTVLHFAADELERLTERPAPALPPDAAALIREARALSIDPYTTEICDALEGALKENARLTRRLALIEQHDTTRVLESQLEMLREERAKDRAAHAREREQILGDLAHARAETERLTRERDAYKRAKEENDERFMTERDAARAEADRMRPVVDAAVQFFAHDPSLNLPDDLRDNHEASVAFNIERGKVINSRYGVLEDATVAFIEAKKGGAQ